MALTYHYKTVTRPNKTTVKSPSIPITLLGNIAFDTLALLDSGADYSAIPKSIADLLGVDYSGKQEKSFGIGGAVNSVQSKMRLRLGNDHEKYIIELKVIVILDPTDFGVILGREGFFNKFKITFDQKEEKIIIKSK